MTLCHFSRALATVAAVAALAACTDSTAPARPVAHLEILSGASQEDLYGGWLPESLTVRAVDANGAPVRGVTVLWTATGGTLSDEASVTRSDGTASVRWFLYDPAATVTAVATEHSAAPATFEGRVYSGPRLEFFAFTDTVAIIDATTPVAVNVTARIRTDYRGINRVGVSFRHLETGFSTNFYDLTLSEGDAFEGTYTGTIQMYASQWPGRWDYVLRIATRGKGSCDCDADPILLFGAFQLNLHYDAPRYLVLTND